MIKPKQLRRQIQVPEPEWDRLYFLTRGLKRERGLKHTRSTVIVELIKKFNRGETIL